MHSVDMFTGHLRSNETVKNTALSNIESFLNNNKSDIKKYKNWKRNCNNYILIRTSIYAAIIFVAIITLLIYANIIKSGDNSIKFNKTFWLSVLLTVIVFSTEVYMLVFVFLRVKLIGELELPYKYLHQWAKYVSNARKISV